MNSDKPKKTKKELEAEKLLYMARLSIRHSILIFAKGEYQEPPAELQEFWDSLNQQDWSNHLKLFTSELKTYKQVTVKKILFDVEHYVKDCRKLVPNFKRTKEEILLMVALGQIDAKEFINHLSGLPSNREKLDRKIHKQIKELDWQDDQALIRLDELTKKLDEPRIKKSEVDKIDSEIKLIENQISARKLKREELAIKLVEWKARGNIDIAGEDGQFRLEA
ncbi:MAG: hypothetical protein RLZZ361_1016 [Cyanobacteriota bacterium]|jgi:hypothetical protein